MNRRPILCSLLLFLSLTFSYAQQIDVDARAGYNGLVEIGRYNPISVDITNSGKNLVATVNVKVDRGTTFRADQTIEYSRRVELPSQARKRIGFSVPLSSPGIPIVITVEASGQTIFTEEISILGKVMYSPLMISLSRTSAFNYLMAETDIIVTYPHVERLPDRWDAYDPVDFISIHDADITALSGEQAAAITKWVESGGYLFVTGGAHLSKQPGQLDALLPVQVMGLARLESVSALEEQLGIDVDAGGGILVSMSRPREGTDVVYQDNVPLLVYQNRGRGRIVFFAGDIGSNPFDSPECRTALWETFSSSFEARGVYAGKGSIFEDPDLPSMIDASRAKGYGRALLVGFLAIYLTGLILLSRRPKRSAAAAMLQIAVFSIGLAFLGYVIFGIYTLNRKFINIDRTVVSPFANGTHAEVTKDIVLIAVGTEKNSITVDQPDTVVLGRNQRTIHIVENGQVTVEDIAIEPWSYQGFTFHTVIPFGFEASLKRRSGLLYLDLANTGDTTILDTVVLYRNRPVQVGVFSPGDTYSTEFEAVDSPLSGFSGTIATESGFYSKMVRNIARESEESMADGSVVVIGRLASSPVQANTGAEFIIREDVSILVHTINPAIE